MFYPSFPLSFLPSLHKHFEDTYYIQAPMLGGKENAIINKTCYLPSDCLQLNREDVYTTLKELIIYLRRENFKKWAFSWIIP